MNGRVPCHHVRVVYNAQSTSASICFHCYSSGRENLVERQNWVELRYLRSSYKLFLDRCSSDSEPTQAFCEGAGFSWRISTKVCESAARGLSTEFIFLGCADSHDGLPRGLELANRPLNWHCFAEQGQQFAAQIATLFALYTKKSHSDAKMLWN